MMQLDILVTYGQIMHFCCTEYSYCKFGALVYKNIQLYMHNVTKYNGYLNIARTLKAKNLQRIQHQLNCSLYLKRNQALACDKDSSSLLITLLSIYALIKVFCLVFFATMSFQTKWMVFKIDCAVVSLQTITRTKDRMSPKTKKQKIFFVPQSLFSNRQ